MEKVLESKPEKLMEVFVDQINRFLIHAYKFELIDFELIDRNKFKEIIFDHYKKMIKEMDVLKDSYPGWLGTSLNANAFCVAKEINSLLKEMKNEKGTL